MTTMTTNAIAENAKTAEFARLFDFFSRLASGDKKLFVPNEFDSIANVPPISPTSSISSLPSLCRSPDSIITTASSSVSTTTHDPDTEYDENETTQNNMKPHTAEDHPVGRGRRTSIPIVRGRDATSRLQRPPLEEDSDESNKSFTFKMMIHELYEIEDFVTMVQEVLETSRQQFQPLPESLKGGGRRDDTGGDKEEKEKFPKSLGLGRPLGLEVPEAERVLKKRRVAGKRSSSVSGGALEKEPEWAGEVSPTNIDDPHSTEESPNVRPHASKTPTTTATARLTIRTRKISTQSSIPRAGSVTPKRAVALSPTVPEASVVKHAESFLNMPREMSSGPPHHSSMYSKGMERVRGEQSEFPEVPMSAPGTRGSFGFETGGNVKAVRGKRRLSFSA